ncbi:MAG: hypothetical protein NC112_05165 [Oxalobacter formigenes]|nr:hypothetical protein [Oxalobacter formigenes]
MQNCPVIAELNRFLAEEARQEARQERREAIAAAIRSTTRRILLGENRPAALKTIETICDHIPGGSIETLLLGAIRHEYSDTGHLLHHIFEKAQTCYIENETARELKRQEELDAENAALSGKICPCGTLMNHAAYA